MESVEKNKNGGSAPRKIEVNFSEAEKEFNAPEKTLEDIIDEELAFDGSSEPKIEEKVDNFKKEPIDFEPDEPVFVANDSAEVQDLTLDLYFDDEEKGPEDVAEPEAKILSMEEEPVLEKKPETNNKIKPEKTKKKKGNGLIGFLLGVIFTTIILFTLFYLASLQIIPNDFFPGKPETPSENPGSGGETSKVTDSELNLAFLKMNDNGQNIIYSPLSIKYALSMLSEGANGNTKTEIDNVLGNLNLTKYENTPEILSLANSVFIRDDFVVNEEFKNTVSSKYDAEVLNDPFADASNINSWISNKTFNLIQNAVPNDAINPSTVMALANALAIQMDWENGFDAEDTTGRDFIKMDGSIYSATTMSDLAYDDDVEYYVDDEVTVVTKDLKEYGDTQLEFVAIMPEMMELAVLNVDCYGENQDCPGTIRETYVDGLDDQKINQLLEKTIPASDAEGGVEVTIPKFKFDYELSNLQNNLIELGIKDAFDPMVADFTNIADELFVSNAIHKANIDFSEDGIKAAAVTVIMMNEATAFSEAPDPIRVNINKPFFFEIRDKKNGEVWFSGVVHEPNHWENDQAAYLAQ